jgi:hypothetical protein
MSMARKIAGSLFLFAMLISAGTASASVRLGESNTNSLATGLVGHWPLNGPSLSWTTDTTQDTSGNGNTGQLVNFSTTTSPVAGKVGGALQFNGLNGYIALGNPASLNNIDAQGGGGMTLSAWIYPRSQGQYGRAGLFYKGTSDGVSTTNGVWALNVPSSSYAIKSFEFLKSFDSTILDVRSTANVITLNRWQHVVMTWDGSASAANVHFYVNGVQTGTSFQQNGVGNKVSDAANAANLGGFSNSAVFDGKLDDVRVYNRALSAQEVQQLYTTGTANIAHSNTVTLRSGLAAYWPLDGNTTSWITDTTQDVSGNGNTGQLVGMSTTTSPVAGKVGQALKFNGTIQNYVMTPLTTTLNDFTVCAWFKDDGVINYFERIVDKSFSTGLWLGRNGLNANSWGGGVEEASSPYGIYVTLKDGVWHQICSIRKGTLHTIVGDGGAVSNSNTVSSAALDGSNVEIGDGTTAQSAGMTIDDVRVYNRALSAQEVQQLYTTGTANIAHSNTVTLRSGLAAYWPLDGNTTSWITDTTQDVSGNGNTGQLIGMSTTTSPVPGKIGQALNFNGSSGEITNFPSSISSPNTTRTLCAWVKSELCGNLGDDGVR